MPDANNAQLEVTSLIPVPKCQSLSFLKHRTTESSTMVLQTLKFRTNAGDSVGRRVWRSWKAGSVHGRVHPEPLKARALPGTHHRAGTNHACKNVFMVHILTHTGRPIRTLMSSRGGSTRARSHQKASLCSRLSSLLGHLWPKAPPFLRQRPVTTLPRSWLLLCRHLQQVHIRDPEP